MYVDTWIIIFGFYLAYLFVKSLEEAKQEIEELKQQLDGEEQDDASSW